MKTRLVLCALMFTALIVRPLSGQVDTGAVRGTINDQSGAVVPDVTVTLTNEDTGVKAVTTSNSEGTYVFAPIKIGTYSVTAEFRGFRKVEQEHVSVNLTLIPGQLTQTIEVTTAVPALQTEDASVGQVVARQQVNDLPLNGRNFTFLAQLSAGVTAGQQDTRMMGASGNFTANGTRPAQNDYLLDGIDNNSNLYDFLNGTNYVVGPPIDAVQEFKVQTSNFSAEFGRAGGAVLNATIKSGTNQIHGDAWEFVRNDAFDAANFFENSGGLPKGEYRLNQFGGTLGGPIAIPKIYDGRNKTFFFIDYEGTRIRQASTYVSTVPTATERSSGFTDLSDLINGQSGTRTDLLGRITPVGAVFDPATTRAVTAGQADPLTGLVATANGFVREPFAGNQILANRLDTNAINLLDLFPPSNSAGLFNNYTSHPIINDTRDQFDARVDHTFSQKDGMFGRLSFSDEPQLLPGPFAGITDGGAYAQGIQTAVNINSALSETHSFSPTLINEARLGYTRLGASRVQPDASNYSNIPAQYGIPGIPQEDLNGGLPQFFLSGLSTLGSSSWLPERQVSQVYQFTENLTKVQGTHSLKAGFEAMRVRAAYLTPAYSRGVFSFGGTYTEVPSTGGGNTGLAQMLLTPQPTTVPGGFDNVGGASGIDITNIDYANMYRPYYAGYFQDDWKVRPKLTVNLGLRLEHIGSYAESSGAYANILPGYSGSSQYLITKSRCDDPRSTSFNQLMQTDGIDVSCVNNPSLVNVPAINFAPRVGIAYQLTPKLVMRAGYGLFYGAYEASGQYRFANYPFIFAFYFNSPDAAHPITYSNGMPGTLETGFNGISLNASTVNAEGIPLQGEQHNYQPTYTESYNFSLQYQLTPNQTFQMAFVGNSGIHLETTPGDNETSEILPPGMNPYAAPYMPWPDFAFWGAYTVEGTNSYYDSGQATFERRFSHGLNFLANYTFAKCRTDSADMLNATAHSGFRAPWLPGFGLQGDYGLCDFDIRQVFHYSGEYTLPFGKGARFLGNSGGVLNQLIGGWKANWILTLQDGQPFTIGCPIGTTANFGCNALLVAGQNPDAGPHNVNHWLNPAAFANPGAATTVGQTDFSPLGGAPGNAIGPGFHRLDFSLFKEFRTSERTHMEIRAEFFNLTNHPNFSYPGFSGNGVSAAPGATDFTNSAEFGTINFTRDGNNDQREIQFALKFYF